MSGTVMVSLSAFTLFSSLSQASDPPKFTAKPTVTKTAAGVKIDFTVSAPTDSAVYILDAQGKVVRHLVAGSLFGAAGAKDAPPEPLKAGLAQSIEWDGKADDGKAAEGGPFKVRVTLGLNPEFDGFLLDNPAASGAVTAVAVGPGGQVYLWHRDCTANGNQGSNKLKVITRDGKYVRTMVPYPADLSSDKAKVLGAFVDTDGGIVPRIYNYMDQSILYEAYGQRGRPMSDYASPAVDSKGRAYWMIAGGRLEAVEPDGSSPYDPFLSPPLFPDLKFFGGSTTLCVGADDKALYLAGGTAAEDSWGKNAKPLPCVFRIDAATRKVEVFIGDTKETGKEKDHFTTPRGLAVAKGLLYVADGGADRVAVFKETDRSYVGEIKVKDPQSIGVDPATGAVYVCVYTTKGMADLIKFDSYEKGQEVCRLAMPKTFEFGTHRIAVDATAKPVRIWLPTTGWQTGAISGFDDLGDKFQAKGDPRDWKQPWAAGSRDLTVDRIRNELYLRYGEQRCCRVDPKSGKILANIDLAHTTSNMGSAGTQVVAAPDGSLVTLSWGCGFRRLDHDGKPLNWPGQSTNAIPYSGIMTFQQRYLAVSSIEDLFVILPTNYRTAPKESGGSITSLNVIGPDGKTKRTVVWQCTAGAVPRLDAKGNVYLADMLKPVGRDYPEFFDGKMARYVKTGHAIGGEKFNADPNEMSTFWESSIYGSIIKFPPTGGIIWYQKNLPPCVEGEPPADLLAKPKVAYSRHIGYNFSPVEVQGAEWVRFGYAPFGEPRGAGFCMCEGVGFDVDAFGRVFYPNLGQFRIEVVDTANNWITTFGQYGNADSGLPGSKAAKPAIPLAWPNYVAVSDDYAFVADAVSSRVVRVKLGSQAEETCDVR